MLKEKIITWNDEIITYFIYFLKLKNLLNTF